MLKGINQFRKPVKWICQQLFAAKREGEDMEALFGIILGQIFLPLLDLLTNQNYTNHKPKCICKKITIRYCV